MLCVLGLAPALPQKPPAALTAAGAAVLNSSESDLTGAKANVATLACADCAAAVGAVRLYVQSHMDNHQGTEAEKLAYFKQKSVSEWSTDCAADVLADAATKTDCNYVFDKIITQDDLTAISLPNADICTDLTGYQCSASFSKEYVKFRATREHCHPASTTVELADGRFVRMDEVQVGDKVRGPSGFEPILGFLHADPKALGTYVRLTTGNKHAISIAPRHFVFINDKATDPSDAAINDLVDTPSGPEPITRIEIVDLRGAFHPFVKGGAYYADGVLASDFVAVGPSFVWELGRYYVELRYELGMPVIPIGTGFISNPQFLFDLLLAAGVPFEVNRDYLYPINLISLVLADLVNTLFEHPAALIGVGAMLTVVASLSLKRGPKAKGL
jgi:hypothetical protein